MKCLSVQQPWANLIASGKKTIEMRSWKTPYRGPLLIVSSKKPDIEPAGCAVAIVTLAGCRSMRKEDETSSHTPFDPNKNSWILESIRPIKPIPVKGELGIYERDIHQEELVLI